MANQADQLEAAEGKIHRIERKQARVEGMGQLVAGFTFVRIAYRVATNMGWLNETPGESRRDEGVAVAGTAIAVRKVIKGGKYANGYAGAALAFASPLIDRVVDSLSEAFAKFMGDKAA